MRRFCAILPVLALAVPGCASSRGVAESVARQSEEIAVLDGRVSELRSLVGKAERAYSERGDEIIAVREVFDTSRPADSLTGTPPLASRVVVRGRSAEARSMETGAVAGMETSDGTVSAGSASSGYEESAVTPVRQASEKRDPRRVWVKIRGTLAWTGLATVAVLVAAVIRKALERRPKGVWTLIKGIFKKRKTTD